MKKKISNTLGFLLISLYLSLRHYDLLNSDMKARVRIGGIFFSVFTLICCMKSKSLPCILILISFLYLKVKN